MILAHRPPISIPRTNVSPALLDELVSEMSTLASVYHKPPGTFIGLGRIGADSMQKREEYVSRSPKPFSWVGFDVRSVAYQTINSRRRRRCKPSQQVNRLRTFSTLMTFLQINHQDWLPPKSPPRYLRLQTLLQEPPRIRSTTSSPSLETSAPHNRHRIRRPQRTCSVPRPLFNLNSSRTRSLGLDWVVRFLPLKSLHPRRQKRKRRKICWGYSRVFCFSFGVYNICLDSGVCGTGLGRGHKTRRDLLFKPE